MNVSTHGKSKTYCYSQCLDRLIRIHTALAFCLLFITHLPIILADNMLDDFEDPGTASEWIFSNGSEYPGADGCFEIVSGIGRNGSSGGRLSFDFTGGGRYVGADRIFDTPISCEGISFWLYGYVPGTHLYVVLIDETGQRILLSLPMRNDCPSGWVRYRVLTGGGCWHWEGADDGIFHGSLRGFSVLVDKYLDYYKTGSIVMDEVMVMDSRSVELDPFGEDLLEEYYHGPVLDKLGVNIHFASPDHEQLDLAAEAGFRFVRMDLVWDWVEQVPGEYDFTEYDDLMDALEARGMAALFILDYANPLYYDGPGAFHPHYGPNTQETWEAFARFALAAAGHFSGKEVCLEIWNEPNIPNFWLPEPDPVDYFHLVYETTFLIKSFHQGNLAPIAHYLSENSRALPSSIPTADLDFNGVVNAVDLVKLRHEAVGDIPIIIGATSSIDAAYFEQLFLQEGLDWFDMVSVHPYRGDKPESFYEEFAVVEDMLANMLSKPEIPVISGEWGYTVTSFEIEWEDALRRQALYAIRQILYNILRRVPKMVWYDLTDDCDNPLEWECNFGLLRHNTLEPKPSFNAVKAFNVLLPAGECRVASFETHLANVHGIVFQNQQHGLAAIWMDRFNTSAQVNIPAGYEPEFFDFFGNPFPGVQRRDDLYILNLNEETGPVYIAGSLIKVDK